MLTTNSFIQELEKVQTSKASVKGTCKAGSNLVWWKSDLEKTKKWESGWQFTEFTPEHLAFYENMTMFLSSHRETTWSERRGNRRIEITVETHNNLQAHSALF